MIARAALQNSLISDAGLVRVSGNVQLPSIAGAATPHLRISRAEAHRPVPCGTAAASIIISLKSTTCQSCALAVTALRLTSLDNPAILAFTDRSYRCHTHNGSRTVHKPACGPP